MTKGGPGGHEPFGRRGQTTRRAVPGDARRHNRALVLRTLFRDGPLSRADLASADEAFLSSSVAGVLPVTSFEGDPIGDGRPGPWTLRARADREAMIAGEDAT